MRVLDFIVKEFRQMRRDKGFLGILIAMPIIQLLLYGYAVTTDVRHLNTVICDMNGSYQSREFVQAVQSSPEYFDIVGWVHTTDEAKAYLDSGKAAVAIVIPSRYSRDLGGGGSGSIQLLLDGSDPQAGTIAGSYLGKIVASQTLSILQTRLQSSGLGSVATAGVDGRVQVWYNPTLQSSFSMVPGVLCIIVGNLTLIMSALAIVRERELGTIEQLLVTPIKNWELMLGKLIPYMILGFVDVLVILGLAIAIFGVPMQGSVWMILGISGLFMLGSLGMGLLVSTVSQTQMQASQFASFYMMPNMMLSGFMFPIANMPAWLQPITYLLPNRYYLESVRGIMMKGNGVAQLTNEIWPLALLSSLIFIAAVLQFRKRLD